MKSKYLTCKGIIYNYLWNNFHENNPDGATAIYKPFTKEQVYNAVGSMMTRTTFNTNFHKLLDDGVITLANPGMNRGMYILSA